MAPELLKPKLPKSDEESENTHDTYVRLSTMRTLMWLFWALIGAGFFFDKNQIAFFLNAAIFLMAVIWGYFLLKIVRKEVEQKKKLAEMNRSIKELSKQRESLIYLSTHKVRGCFTHSKYIFSEILEGTFGPVSAEIKSIAEKGLESDNEGISMVDTLLNASNLTMGDIKYDKKTVSMGDMVKKVLEREKGIILKKGLTLNVKIGEDKYEIFGDSFWVKEAISNLIENAIRYTESGHITIGLQRGDENNLKKVLFYVKDTGIGITEEDKKNLFTEGGRGKESVKINVDSTGYGLYTVKLVVEAHQGKVWAESEGAGKGAQFYLELPAIDQD